MTTSRSDGTSGAVACSFLDRLPSELIQEKVAGEYLNPLDRSRLSSCSKRLHRLLPAPLRLRIVSSRGDSSLAAEFFVSPATDAGTSEAGDDAGYWGGAIACRKEESVVHARLLEATENLVYGRRYYFWTFDYERENRVFLGRHSRHELENGENLQLRHCYTVGLRPRTPNQSWEVIGGEDGDVVMWGEDVGLSVGGLNLTQQLPDSNVRQLLSCFPRNSSPSLDFSQTAELSWIATEGEWGENEKLQLIPCPQFVPGNDVEEKELIVHAIPEACAAGEYFLHHPASLNDGLVSCEGFHIVVTFEFWIKEGIMNFWAPVLPFTFGIPILESDCCSLELTKKSPIANLLHIKSARWGCLIYYMAVAADVKQGIPLDLDQFLIRVPTHKDHSVEINDAKDFVYIRLKNQHPYKNAPELARAKKATPWCFLLTS